jgi:hypothetical protein
MQRENELRRRARRWRVLREYPTLYAIADATGALKAERANIRVVSIGVGEYPRPKPSLFSIVRWAKYLVSVRLLQKVLEVNTQSMDQIREVLFQDLDTVRVSERYTRRNTAQGYAPRSDISTNSLPTENVCASGSTEYWPDHLAQSVRRRIMIYDVPGVSGFRSRRLAISSHGQDADHTNVWPDPF